MESYSLLSGCVLRGLWTEKPDNHQLLMKEQSSHLGRDESFRAIPAQDCTPESRSLALPYLCLLSSSLESFLPTNDQKRKPQADSFWGI